MLSIGRDNLQFYLNFAQFSTLGGMNLDGCNGYDGLKGYNPYGGFRDYTAGITYNGIIGGIFPGFIEYGGYTKELEFMGVVEEVEKGILK